MQLTSSTLPALNLRALALATAAMLPFVAHAQLNVSAVYRNASVGICGGAGLPSSGFGDRPGFGAFDDGAQITRTFTADCNGLSVTSAADQSAVATQTGVTVSAQYQVAFSGASRNPYPAGQTPPVQDLMLAPSKAVTGRAFGQVHVDFSLAEQTEFLISGSNNVPLVGSLYDAQNNEYLIEAFSLIHGTQRTASLVLGPGQYTLDFNAGAALALGYFEGFSGASQVSKTLNFSMQAVPEPSTWALMGLGLAGLGMARRRRSKN